MIKANTTVLIAELEAASIMLNPGSFVQTLILQALERAREIQAEYVKLSEDIRCTGWAAASIEDAVAAYCNFMEN